MTEELNAFDCAYNELFRGRALNTQHLNDCEKIWRAALTQRPAAQAGEREAFEATAPIPTPAPPFATYDEHGNGCDDEIQDFYYRHCQEVETRAFNRGYDAASLPTQPAAQAKPEPMLNKHWSFMQQFDDARANIAAISQAMEMSTPQQATPEPAGEPLQGGLGNDALLNAWRSKLPGVTPTDAQMTAFALGVEVGFAHARTLERSDWSRVHDVLKKAGVHPGRTDDHLADVIAKALFTRPAPGVPEGFALVPVEPTREMNRAGFDAHHATGLTGEIWRAMLAAAQAKGADK